MRLLIASNDITQLTPAFCGQSSPCRISGDMQKSIHSPEYQHVLTTLVAMRKQAGLTQRDLAVKLGREHSFVWRIETGERRLDLVEFHWVCQALGQNAGTIYQTLVKDFSKPAKTSFPAPDPIRKAADAGVPYQIPRRKTGSSES